MDQIDIDIMEEDMPTVEMIRECARLWDKYGDDDTPDTNIVWDDLQNVVRQDLSTLRKLQRHKREVALWRNL